ncbi:MAG: hypothetical protein Q9168_007557, partial [Polycauliona sp. 1 TL-2023]
VGEREGRGDGRAVEEEIERGDGMRGDEERGGGFAGESIEISPESAKEEGEGVVKGPVVGKEGGVVGGEVMEGGCRDVEMGGAEEMMGADGKAGPDKMIGADGLAGSDELACADGMVCSDELAGVQDPSAESFTTGISSARDPSIDDPALK